MEETINLKKRKSEFCLANDSSDKQPQGIFSHFVYPTSLRIFLNKEELLNSEFNL